MNNYVWVGYVSRDTSPMMGEVSRNVAHLNILVHDVINLLHYEYWTDEQKYFYVYHFKELVASIIVIL